MPNDLDTKPEGVNLEQKMAQKKLVAEWAQEVMRLKSLAPSTWGRKAHAGPNAVKRILDMANPDLPSLTTLLKLSEFAKVPLPINFNLDGVAVVPGPEVLAGILSLYLKNLMPDIAWDDRPISTMAAALHYTLLELVEDSEAAEDLRIAERIASAVLRQQSRNPGSE